LEDILRRRRPRPETVVILCTHFGLAHQLATVKDTLAETLGVKVVLAVVVTDDSPQLLWAVPGVDIEFVPSATTRTQLLRYMEKISGKVPEIMVAPYPVDPRLNMPLTAKEMGIRRAQLVPKGKQPLQLMVPISGAAVQLSFMRELLVSLIEEQKATVTVVARESDSTHDFLDWCQDEASIKVAAHWFDSRVVEIYEEEMEKTVFGVEITKPSEQAFKVLLSPKTQGGVILLFSDPVGRQEDDNLMFMRRHGLLPSLAEQRAIEGWLESGGTLPKEILDQAKAWRGLMLPEDGSLAGRAIGQFRQSGLLQAMVDFTGYMPGHPELSGDGVEKIWEELSEKV
jgi:hypothetical protein